ncbi:hypothetical protein POSPLADRAFT_1181058 [Postia placenta MAD-698-R-SB12]|uniref:Uncharacterized protein n=1 Tax=Postia placenta MAD-698-R-SB12 TaxID=670580 RepID=A0A1X6N2Y0_9APHY|nr:hypothetical protein POSPLADRAFT_1181058 [Postia placenta MAD-698-R-SB12]OSX62987.1 hypothetical protein POSPLADRAFT_1181058 [Postia placenta MAD-698-R-SB12]
MPIHTGADFVTTVRHDTYPAIDPAKADLAGKVVLITGASKGIGKAIAIAFAQAGASGLVLFARSDMSAATAACEAAARPGQDLKVLAISVDTTDAAQVADALAKVKAAFGRLDILVNNAGYMEHYKLIHEQDPEEWWKPFEVNLRGTYLVTRAFLPLLIECGGERTIINMSSVAAHMIHPAFSAYLSFLWTSILLNGLKVGDTSMARCRIDHLGVLEADESVTLFSPNSLRVERPMSHTQQADTNSRRLINSVARAHSASPKWVFGWALLPAKLALSSRRGYRADGQCILTGCA